MLELGGVTIIMKKKTCANPKNKNITKSNYSKKKKNPFKIFVLGSGQLRSLCQMHLHEHETP